MTKKAVLVKSKPARLIERHPLEYNFKRGKKNRRAVEEVVISRGGAFSQFAPNWLGAGLLSATLKALFESEEPQFVEARAFIRELGITKRPKPVHFQALTLIEANFPQLIGREELAEQLDIEVAEVGRILHYLRGFSAIMCGVNILRDGQGNVGIADRALWMDFQNHLSRTKSGVDSAQKRHGLSHENLQRHGIRIQEETLIQPALMLGMEGDHEA